MTNEKMPSDSAKTTMMMPFVRIAFAASGLRPVASATFEPAMPMPSPAPRTPNPIAMPAPSQARFMPFLLVCSSRVSRFDRALVPFRRVLLAMRLQRQDDVEEHEEREHECLDEAGEKLQSDEGKREARDEQQRREHCEHDL